MRCSAQTWAHAFAASVEKEAADELAHESCFVSGSSVGHIQLRIAESPTAGFGFQIWPAARALCYFLEQRRATQLQGRRVLELGSGCGLVGLLAAHLGATVTLTDLDAVLSITRHNVKLNPTGIDSSIDVRELRWGLDVRDAFGQDRFDVILGADLIYAEKLHGALLATLLQLVSEETEVLLANTRRDTGIFLRWLRRVERLFHAEEVVTEEELAAIPGLISTGKPPISIWRIQLCGPLPFPDDFTELFKGLDYTEGAAEEQLMARLALRECDLNTVDVVEEKEQDDEEEPEQRMLGRI